MSDVDSEFSDGSGVQTRSQKKLFQLKELEKTNNKTTETPVKNKSPSCSQSNGKMSELADLISLLTAKYSEDGSGAKAEDMVTCFSGETGISVTKWFENFDALAKTYRWTETQKLIFARNKMTKVAKVFMQTLTVSNYNDFKTMVIAEFSHTYSSIDIHNQLRERKKKRTKMYTITFYICVT